MDGEEVGGRGGGGGELGEDGEDEVVGELVEVVKPRSLPLPPPMALAVGGGGGLRRRPLPLLPDRRWRRLTAAARGVERPAPRPHGCLRRRGNGRGGAGRGEAPLVVWRR